MAENTVKTKEVPFEEAPAFFEGLRKEGQVLVQCHGTFDLIHPGHIVHLEEAKGFGDKLVVTLTAEEFVNKGPGRPYFNDSLRVKSLSALEVVDYVVVVPFPAAVEAIACVKPQVYCKGKEYADESNDVTGNIRDDVKTVKTFGGRMEYIGSVVFSSTRLLNNHFDTIDPESQDFCRELSKTLGPERFVNTVEDFARMKVLLVGDVIFDRYTTVQVQGLTSKGKVISSRFMEDEVQPGGALAVYRHLQQFCDKIKLLSIVGKEPFVEDALSEHVAPDSDEIIRLPYFTTVVKQRFVEPLAEGKELNKLFAVNYIDAKHPNGPTQELLCQRFERLVEDFDLVLVMDFGHGVMQGAMRSIVQEKSRFLSVNCQTNSNNYGFNLINRQYRKVDCFTIDEAELSLAVNRKDADFCVELEGLRGHLGAEYAWLTRGGSHTVGIQRDRHPCRLLALEQSVVDTVGAGDAFCALASLSAARGLPVETGTFFGQLAGAQAVKIPGNRQHIQKSKFLKAGISLLSY